MSKAKQDCLTFDLQNQLRFELAAHEAIWSDVPQLVVLASLRGNTQPAAWHHHAACVLQATVLHHLETARTCQMKMEMC